MTSYTSKLIASSHHAFFTKHHGIQKDDILNFNSSRVGKVTKATKKNLKFISRHFNVTLGQLIFLVQTHSNNCVTLDSTSDHIQSNSIPTIFKGDAVISNIKGKVLCITTADCIPILLLDKRRNIAGAVHSGWKGALNNLLENTLEAFENLGSNKSDIFAVIGPAISKEVYEVKSDFVSKFRSQNTGNTNFFKFGECTTFDLIGFVVNKLRTLGIKKIEKLAECTFINEEDFFSHRRSTVQGSFEKGRQISAIKV